ncbi:MAG: hypothetical protein IT359_15755 [Gemmatimonadaceae bacterium]|nr:hypothetical protein [Gemmatimonadaceae bacterium]
MRYTNVDRTITLVHTPGMHWILGGLFIAVGIVAMVASLAVSPDVGGSVAMERLGGATAGFVALVAGTWVCWRSPRTQAVLDQASGLWRIERLGIGVRETIEFPVDVVDAVELDHAKDDEGGDIYRPALRLRDGRLVLLSPVWLHHGPQHVAQQLARAIDRPLTRPALPR